MSIYDKLNEPQREAVYHTDGPLLILAGAGSGKTRVLTHRIAYLIGERGVNPWNILAITFTNKAAEEMRQRVDNLVGFGAESVWVSTFHSACVRILRRFIDRLGYENHFTIYDTDDQKTLIKEVCRKVDVDTKVFKERSLLSAISSAKNEMILPDEFELNAGGDFAKMKIAKVYREYEAQMRANNALDFDDLLVKTVQLLQTQPDVLESYQERFRYIMVDEYQDTNTVQFQLVSLLAGKYKNLCVVGDDDQSVYGFRGAKPGIMKDFMRDYPEAKRILLDINYRSNAHIVKGALRVIGHNKDRYEKEIQPFREAQETVHVQETLDPLDESKYILKEIQKYMKKGVDLKQMAVLYRTGEDARVLAETFTQYQIPFSMKERIHHLYEHFVCTDMNCYFRLAVGTYDRGDFLEIANRPKRYLSRGCMEETPVTYESLRRFYCDKEWMQDRIDQLEWDMKMIRTKTPYAAIQYIRKSIGYDEFLKEYALGHQMEYSELKEIMDELQERTKEFQTLPEWLAHVEEYKHTLQMQRQQRGNGTGDGVTCLTMHGAKGLEYEVVFVIESNEGVTPYKKAGTPEELEEERRLFYVAMTRAKKKLFITYVKEKNGKDLLPSRFVSELLLNV